MEREFDLQSQLDSAGLVLESIDEQGRPVVSDPLNPNDGERTININRMMEASGFNPKMDTVKYNDDSRPLKDNAIGFSTGVQLALATDPEVKKTLLEQTYGEDNVKTNSFGKLVIKQNGAWRSADASFVQEMGAEGGDIWGGITGAVVGATLLAPIPIVGIPLGGVLGGAVGATIGHAGMNELAEKLGLRTELDLPSI